MLFRILHAILILSIAGGMRSVNAVKGISKRRVLHVHLQIQAVAKPACRPVQLRGVVSRQGIARRVQVAEGAKVVLVKGHGTSLRDRGSGRC